MRVAVVVLALGGFVASGAAEDGSPLDLEGVFGPRRVARAPAPASSLGLVWVDPAGVGVGVEGLARDEARTLLRRMGVPVSWRRGKAGDPSRPGEVSVILLDRAVQRASGVPVLGATLERFGVQPLVWIHVPNVRAVLGLSPDGPAAATDLASSRALAIALGRVVAHELVHALVPSLSHGTGLMSATLTLRQLTASTLAFDPQVGLAVRAALRGEAPLPPAGAGTLASAAAEQELER
jgi:hypothetical protein